MPEFATIFPLEESTMDEAPLVRAPAGPWDDDEVIDTILRLVADHHRALGAAIGRHAFSPTLAELRQSPLGQDLRVLATAEQGGVSPDRALETASRVTDLLLRPLVRIPRLDQRLQPAMFPQQLARLPVVVIKIRLAHEPFQFAQARLLLLDDAVVFHESVRSPAFRRSGSCVLQCLSNLAAIRPKTKTVPRRRARSRSSSRT